jgi:phosphatidylglycerol---prolipoprotein diacylglyceryl transferase
MIHQICNLYIPQSSNARIARCDRHQLKLSCLNLSSNMTILGWLFTSPGEQIPYLGGFLKWYGVLIASAVLIGVSLSTRLAQKRNIDPDLVGDLAIWLVIGAIPMARLYYVAFEWQHKYAQNPGQIIKIWEGGIAIHGAIIGGTIAAIIFAKIKQVSFWKLADIVMPSVALGQAIGRWGNFFNSEAFGSPTDLPWKLYIPIGSRPAGYLNVEYFHPTFLYESIWNLLVFGLLITLFNWDIRKSNLKPGTLFLVYAIAYSVGRLAIESLRTDSLTIGGLKTAQIVSLIGIGIGAIGLMWLYLRNRPLPDVIAPPKIVN